MVGLSTSQERGQMNEDSGAKMEAVTTDCRKLKVAAEEEPCVCVHLKLHLVSIVGHLFTKM